MGEPGIAPRGGDFAGEFEEHLFEQFGVENSLCGVLWVGGVLGRMGAEGKRVGAEFVVGGAGGECFDDPEGGSSRLGGNFADEWNADGGGTVAEGPLGWSEVVSEDGKNTC